MMILEGKIAILYFIAYFLLVLAIFQGKSFTEVWRITTGSVILGLSLFVTLFVPYSSVARRASVLGKITRGLEFWKSMIYNACAVSPSVNVA